MRFSASTITVLIHYLFMHYHGRLFGHLSIMHFLGCWVAVKSAALCDCILAKLKDLRAYVGKQCMKAKTG